MSDFTVVEKQIGNLTGTIQYTETDPVMGLAFKNELSALREVLNLGRVEGQPEYQDPQAIKTAIENGTFHTDIEQNLKDLALLVGGVVDPQTGKTHYLSQNMANALEKIFESWKLVGIHINSQGEIVDANGAPTNITINQVLVWKSIAEQNDIINDTISGAEIAAATGIASLQSLSELIYVKTGTEVLTNQLDDLEEALGSTKDTLDMLTDAQDLHNKVVIPDPIPPGYNSTTSGPDFLNGDITFSQNDDNDASSWKKEFEAYYEDYFKEPIQPEADFSAFDTSGSIDPINLPSPDNILDIDVFTGQQARAFSYTNNLLNANATEVDNAFYSIDNGPLVKTTDPNNDLYIDLDFNNLLAEHGDIDGLIQNPEQFTQFRENLDKQVDIQSLLVLDDDKDGQIDNKYLTNGKLDLLKINTELGANTVIGRLVKMQQDIEAIENTVLDLFQNQTVTSTIKYELVDDFKKGKAWQDVNDDGVENDGDVFDTSYADPDADEVKAMSQILLGVSDESGPLWTKEVTATDTIANLLSQPPNNIDINNIKDTTLFKSTVLKAWLTDGRADTIVVDKIEIPQTKTVKVVLNMNLTNDVSQEIEFKIKGTLTIPPIQIAKANATQTNTVQDGITKAITAAESLNDKQKDELRRFMFIFEEYYKSAAAILNKITQIIEKVAQGVAR